MAPRISGALASCSGPGALVTVGCLRLAVSLVFLWRVKMRDSRLGTRACGTGDGIRSDETGRRVREVRVLRDLLWRYTMTTGMFVEPRAPGSTR